MKKSCTYWCLKLFSVLLFIVLIQVDVGAVDNADNDREKVCCECLESLENDCIQFDPSFPSPFHFCECFLCCECCRVNIDKFDDEIGYNRHGYPVAVGKDKDNIIVQLCCDCPGRKCIDSSCQICCCMPICATTCSCLIGSRVVGCVEKIGYLVFYPLTYIVRSTCYDAIVCEKNLEGDACSELFSGILPKSCFYSPYSTKFLSGMPHCCMASCIKCLGGVCCAEQYLETMSYAEMRECDKKDFPLKSIVEENIRGMDYNYTGRCGQKYLARTLLVSNKLNEHRACCRMGVPVIKPPAVVMMGDNAS